MIRKTSGKLLFLSLLLISTSYAAGDLGNDNKNADKEDDKIVKLEDIETSTTDTDANSTSDEAENSANKPQKRSYYSPSQGYYYGPYYRDGRYYNRLSVGRTYGSYYGRSEGCVGNPCGTNALCTETSGNRPVCTCPPGYKGNPISLCTRNECTDNIECRSDQACRNGVCVNPCLGSCGVNAHCEVNNHVAVCSCPKGYEGDPFFTCRLSDPEKQCHPSPCGANTKCEVINGAPTCSCLPSFRGNPLTGCRHECEYDSECGSQEMCKDFKCIAACTACGKLSQCSSVRDHRAVCECPKGYIGSPYTECRPECYGDVDCPSGRPACIYGICKNPCEGSCGVDADCNLRGLTPICSCPKTHTGDPFVRCRPFTKEDLCIPNPCGSNAICTPGHDNTGRERPVCTCPPGYTGNALSYCAKGECQENSECPDNKACLNSQCVNPCVNKCGAGAICEAKSHLAVCKCPDGTNGDALVSCRTSRKYPVAKYEQYPYYYSLRN